MRIYPLAFGSSKSDGQTVAKSGSRVGEILRGRVGSRVGEILRTSTRLNSGYATKLNSEISKSVFPARLNSRCLRLFWDDLASGVALEFGKGASSPRLGF